MPLTPAGAPAVRASTRWTMVSLSSWSPPEIHILLPCSRNVPSSWGSAVVSTSASEEPACGSLRHIVPKKRPSSIGRTYRSTCSADPCSTSSEALAWVRNG